MSFFSRYKDYTPLWSEVSNSKPNLRKHVAVAVALLGASLLLNAILYSKLSNEPRLALDDYQRLCVYANALPEPVRY